jgi:hypothetical protein
MRKYLVFIVLILGAAPAAFSARYVGEFLEVGAGARAVAMGGAYTAVADDPSSFYWNPSGLGYIEGLKLSGMYADLWEGLASYSVVGLAAAVPGAVVGINLIRLSVTDIPRYPDYDNRYLYPYGDSLQGIPFPYDDPREYIVALHGQPTGYFSDTESAIFLSFAKLNEFTLDLGWSYFTLPVQLPIGANLKIIQRSLASATATGVGADLGMQVRVRTQDLMGPKLPGWLSAGFNLQDMTRTQVNWGKDIRDAIPTNFRVGVAYIAEISRLRGQLTMSYDTEERYERAHHFGLEYRYEKVLAVRGGFWDDEWTAGAGIAFWRIGVDYAYRARDLGTTHRVSLAIQL